MSQKGERKKMYYIALLCASIIIIIAEGILIKHTDIGVDEVFSYGLSNHTFVDTIEMKPQDGYVYQKGIEPFVEYMAVQKDGRFQYANVWKNQSEDVHPPLYYAILHTICSFFPMSISRWYAGSINIVFLLMTLIVSTNLIFHLTRDRKISIIFSLFFATSSFMLNTATFLRMYSMAMFWCTLYTFLLIKNVNEGFNKKFLIYIYISSVLGALTHYYVIVYLVLISVVYSILKLVKKEYRQTLSFCLVMLMAAFTSVLIFPAMIDHLFISDRGKQSLGNAVIGMGEYLEKLKSYIQTVFWGILGNVTKIIMVVLMIGVLLVILKKRKIIKRDNLFSYILLLCPSIAYVLMISKVSVYVTDRYMYPVYAIIIVNIFVGIYYVVSEFSCKKWQTIMIAGFICLIFNIDGFKNIFIPYMNTINEREIQEEQYFTNRNCVYVYDPYELWKIQAEYLKISKCDKTMFILDSEYETFMKSELADSDELIVYISNTLDTDFLLLSMETITPNTNECEVISDGGYTSIYYLHK